MASRVRPDGSATGVQESAALGAAIRSAQAVLILSAAALLVLGVIIWTGQADQLISVHMLLGIVLVLSLWTIAAIAERAGVSGRLVAAAVAWSILAPILGATQEALLVGDRHWTIQVLHVVIAMGVVAWGRVLVISVKRSFSINRDRLLDGPVVGG